MRLEDVLLVALPSALTLALLAGAIAYRLRARRIGRAPRITASHLARGAVVEGTLVQLVGAVHGPGSRAPWSDAPCAGWVHVFTHVYDEDHPHGVRSASACVEQRVSDGWSITDGTTHVPVHALDPRARWTAAALVAQGRRDVGGDAPQTPWRIGHAQIAVPTWRAVPGTRPRELRAEERVVRAGETLVVVGVARRSPGGWVIALEHERCGVTHHGARELSGDDRRASVVLVGASVLALALVCLGVVALAWPEPDCAGELQAPRGRPAVCCVSAAGERAHELRIAPHEAELLVRVSADGIAPRLEIEGELSVEGELVTLAPASTPRVLRVGAVGGALLPRFCVRLDAQ